MLTSLCISTYERTTHLTDVFQALARHAVSPYEIIVVDDCSKNPDVFKLILEFKRRFEEKGIRFVAIKNEKNLKHAATQNKAWRYAKGDILFHIEDDIICPQDGFNQRFAKAFQDHPEVGQFVPEGSGRGEWIPRGPYNEYAWALGGLFAVRREVFQQVGGWDESLCLSGDTKIPLLNGTAKTIRELSAGSVEGLFTYSLDSSGRIVPGRIKKAWKSGVRDVLKVTLDNGESFHLTSNHPVMLRDGAYVSADKLQMRCRLAAMGTGQEKSLSEKSILAIERLKTQEEVFDLEIDEHHNFAIGCADGSGIFVHNCHQVEPDYNLRVRMAGWRLAEVPGVRMVHLGEGEEHETFKRQAQILAGVHTMLFKWNKRFLGVWDYDSVWSMSWDDFPPNAAFRRKLAAWYAAEAEKLQDRYRGLGVAKDDPHYANAVPDEIRKAHEGLKRHRLNQNPEPFKFAGHWGAYELVKTIRPIGREREQELITLMKSNHAFRDVFRFGDSLKALAQRMNYNLTNEEYERLISEVPRDYRWEGTPVYRK